jgi:serine/threonine protein kinase
VRTLAVARQRSNAYCLHAESVFAFALLLCMHSTPPRPFMVILVWLANVQLRTLKFAHVKQYVYQDLKPANVMIGCDGSPNTVFLVDWGCCRKYVSMSGAMLTDGGEMGNDMFRSVAAVGGSRKYVCVCVCVEGGGGLAKGSHFLYCSIV